MEIRYILTSEEINLVEFSTRLVSNRLERPYGISRKGTYYEPYGQGRVDMFWVNCYLGDFDLGPISIEPSIAIPEDFCISKNYNKVDYSCYDELCHRARKWFMEQPEYKQQVEWTRELKRLIAEDKANGIYRPWIELILIYN